MSSWFVQSTVVPALIVTVSGVNLKLTMPTGTVPAETAGDPCVDVAEPTGAIWPAGIAIGMSQAGAVVAGPVPDAPPPRGPQAHGARAPPPPAPRAQNPSK